MTLASLLPASVAVSCSNKLAYVIVSVVAINHCFSVKLQTRTSPYPREELGTRIQRCPVVLGNQIHSKFACDIVSCKAGIGLSATTEKLPNILEPEPASWDGCAKLGEAGKKFCTPFAIDDSGFAMDSLNNGDLLRDPLTAFLSCYIGGTC